MQFIIKLLASVVKFKYLFDVIRLVKFLYKLRKAYKAEGMDSLFSDDSDALEDLIVILARMLEADDTSPMRVGERNTIINQISKVKAKRS